MGIVTVTERFEEYEAKVDSRGFWSGTRAFNVVCTSRTENAVDVKAAVSSTLPVGTLWPLPVTGAVYLRVTDHAVSRVLPDAPNVFVVRVTYGHSLDAHPALKPWVFSYGTQDETRGFFVDRAGVAVLNGAKDRFAEPADYDAKLVTMTAAKAVYPADFHPRSMILYTGSINDAAFATDLGGRYTSDPLVVPYASCRCANLTATEVFDEWGYYLTLNATFLFTDLDFRFRPLNAGFNERIQVKAAVGATPAVFALVPIRDPRDGQALSTPVPLTTDGKRLPDGGTPNYLNLSRYREVSFAGIGCF